MRRLAYVFEVVLFTAVFGLSWGMALAKRFEGER